MELNWIDVTNLSFNSLLLLERVQLSWFRGWVPEEELAIALRGNPAVEWYMRHKCPEIVPWLDQVTSTYRKTLAPSKKRIRQAEIKIMKTINDLMVYAIDPSLYDARPFMGWDSNELRMVTDFSGKTVIDVGSGTGRLAFIAAEKAAVVFAVEPVGNLRLYIQQKAQKENLRNIFAVDGLINSLPFPDRFADITMSGHVYGDTPEASYFEMKRVTRLGGMIILCPGSAPHETQAHEYLISKGFAWSEYEEPTEGPKRKYWKLID